MKSSAQSAFINCALALERVGGDEALFKEIGQLFLGEYRELLESLERAVQTSDADGIHKVAHTLKGSLGTLGAEDAMKSALQMELYGRQGDVSSAAIHLQNLIEALQKVEHELREIIN
jgi:HPt (histidine-containing phosphotransfer) domain-containing protein